MTRRAVVVDTRALLVAVDDPPPVAERWSALATGRVVDEETGQAVAARTSGVSPQPGVTVTAAGDGSFCLVGRPWLACPPLLAPSYTITAMLTVDGYRPVELTVAVPTHQRQIVAPAPVLGSPVLALNVVSGLVAGQILAIGPAATAERALIRHLGPGLQQVTLDGGLGLPHAIGDPVVADGWQPVDLGDIPLRRRPVVIRGRAVRRDTVTNVVTAVPNATLAVVDFWTTLAAIHAQIPGSMTDPNPLARMFVASVSPGLVTDRDVGPGQVGRQVLSPVAGDDRRLAAPVAAGATSFRVSARQGIAASSILRVDPDHADVSETVVVTAVTGFGAPDQPGQVTVGLPFRSDHRAGVRVQPLTALPPAPTTTLRRPAQAGDRVVFVADLTGLPDGADIRLTGGTAPVEYQRLHRLEVTTDADGYFTLPPLHRIAGLAFQATAPLLPTLTFTYQPEYLQPENRLDVVFA